MLFAYVFELVRGFPFFFFTVKLKK